MKAALQDPPVCCASHTARFLPVPETDEERQAVEAAERRWDDEFYLVGEYADPPDGRTSTEDLPDYVIALRERAR